MGVSNGKETPQMDQILTFVDFLRDHHLGETEGGVYRMESSGVVSDFLLEVEGQPLPPTNYVHLDTNGRVMDYRQYPPDS